MLKDYPTYFNTFELPFTKKWSEDYDTIEEVNTSEAGTDIVDVSRYNKLSVSCSIGCLSTMAKQLMIFSEMPYFTLRKYDILTEAYKEYTVRMRDFKVDRIEQSESVAISNGLWKVSFKLEEF